MGNWILILILILLVILGVVASIFAKKGKKRPMDYYTLFIMGIIWIPTGLLMWLADHGLVIGLVFVAMGVSYVVIGLVHKDEWKKNYVKWDKLKDKEKYILSIVLFSLGALVLAGLVVLYFVRA